MAADPLVRRLLSAEAYPHPVENVHLIETHISWVFLTGHYVYKVKKPVDLGFLDFSTLAKRKHFCHEEVRLNRRFAPSLYLGVVPITGTAGEAMLGGDGEPSEWAVQLAAFDEACRLDTLLDTGSLSEGDCEQLAGEIAAVQQRLEVASMETDWGTAETVANTIEMNLQQLCEHRDDVVERSERLGEWVREQVEKQREVFHRRRLTGRVRQCHGDLHLANLVRHQGRFVAFDSIEFSELLRWIDVASDVAFLAMDLKSRGRGDLAGIVTSSWMEAANDHDATAVLLIYQVYRAIVRSVIAAIRGTQPDANTHAAHTESDRYLDLAEQLATPKPAVLYATCGVSGSGKTTLAKQLVRAESAIHVRSDVERKRLFGMAPTDRPGSAEAAATLYAETATRQTYERLADLATRILRNGSSVVVDAACTTRWQRALLTDAARATGRPLIWLAPELSEGELLSRVEARRQRNDDASDASAAVVRQQLQHFEPLTDSELASYPHTQLLRRPTTASAASPIADSQT